MTVSWKFGANHTINVSKYDDGKCELSLNFRQNVIEEIQKIRPGGLDFVFACTGLIH